MNQDAGSVTGLDAESGSEQVLRFGHPLQSVTALGHQVLVVISPGKTFAGEIEERKATWGASSSRSINSTLPTLHSPRARSRVRSSGPTCASSCSATPTPRRPTASGSNPSLRPRCRRCRPTGGRTPSRCATTTASRRRRMRRSPRARSATASNAPVTQAQRQPAGRGVSARHSRRDRVPGRITGPHLRNPRRREQHLIHPRSTLRRLPRATLPALLLSRSARHANRPRRVVHARAGDRGAVHDDRAQQRRVLVRDWNPKLSRASSARARRDRSPRGHRRRDCRRARREAELGRSLRSIAPAPFSIPGERSLDVGDRAVPRPSRAARATARRRSAASATSCSTRPAALPQRAGTPSRRARPRSLRARAAIRLHAERPTPAAASGDYQPALLTPPAREITPVVPADGPASMLVQAMGQACQQLAAIVVVVLAPLGIAVELREASNPYSALQRAPASIDIFDSGTQLLDPDPAASSSACCSGTCRARGCRRRRLLHSRHSTGSTAPPRRGCGTTRKRRNRDAMRPSSRQRFPDHQHSVSSRSAGRVWTGEDTGLDFASLCLR